MKKVLLLAVFAIALASCEKEELNETESQQVATFSKIVGTAELYRDEHLESVIDQWTGTEWTTVDKWFQNTRENSEIILEFKDDGTFIDRYADVPVANGVWGELSDGRYYFDYTLGDNNANNQLSGRRIITVFCDNTYAVETEGNTRAINYYRIIGTEECSNLINYNVE